jgi:hypothetical protein
MAGDRVRWDERSACKGEATEVFFPAGSGSLAPDYGPALAICAGCDVRAECYAQAVADGDIDAQGRAVFGVIAGVAPDPKARLPRPVARCGTQPGYKRHLRNGEDACAACLAANRRARAEFRRRARLA